LFRNKWGAHEATDDVLRYEWLLDRQYCNHRLTADERKEFTALVTRIQNFNTSYVSDVQVISVLEHIEKMVQRELEASCLNMGMFMQRLFEENQAR